MKSKPLNDSPYLLASDFDQTLSFNDSGYVLWDLLGIRDPFCTLGPPSVSIGTSSSQDSNPISLGQLVRLLIRKQRNLPGILCRVSYPTRRYGSHRLRCTRPKRTSCFVKCRSSNA